MYIRSGVLIFSKLHEVIIPLSYLPGNNFEFAWIPLTEKILILHGPVTMFGFIFYHVYDVYNLLCPSSQSTFQAANRRTCTSVVDSGKDMLLFYLASW